MKARLVFASFLLLALFLFTSPFLFPSGISNGGGLSGITLNAIVKGAGAGPVVASTCTEDGSTFSCPAVNMSTGGNFTSAGNVRAGAGGFIFWNGQTIMAPLSDGTIRFTNAAGSSGITMDFTTDSVLSLANRTNATSATLAFPTANGNGLRFKTGSNGRVGTGTLAGGTLAVANTTVTANTFIFVQDTGGGVIANIGALYVASQTAGVGFTVTSSNAIDTSTFKYWLFETN